MANTVNILEVTLAQISNSTVRPNLASEFGLAPITGVKQTRSWSYEPMVLRVTDHPADDGGVTDYVEGMALFCSQRHGEPWVMIGHQTEHLIHPLPGVTNAPIVGAASYHTIYPDFDYSTF
jgi:hypothetical protein